MYNESTGDNQAGRGGRCREVGTSIRRAFPRALAPSINLIGTVKPESNGDPKGRNASGEGVLVEGPR